MSPKQNSLQKEYYSSYDDNVSYGLLPQNQRIMGMAMRTYDLMEYGAFSDKLRATLAKQALDNTAFLAKLEEEYLRMAPSGAKEYDLIVKAYAYQAAARIVGGDY